jgi:hypothetical protein
MKTESKPVPQTSTAQTEMIVAGPTSPSATGAAPARPKKKAVAAKVKAALPAKTGKGEARHTPRTRSEVGKLVCRYCGSDDLAPSFTKRRDARCRACFKKRYSAGARSNKSARPREATAAK